MDGAPAPLGKLASIFGGVALLLCIPAVIFYAADHSFSARADRADGIVTALTAKNFSRGLHAEIEFEAAGRKITFRETVGSSLPSRKVGDRVGVMYDPGDPSNAMVDSFWNHHLFTVVFGAIGGSFLLTAGILGGLALSKR